MMVFAVACGEPSTGTDAGVDAGQQTMFAKYGAAGFTKVNDNIIAGALAAPTSSLGTSFQSLNDTQKTNLRTNLANFLIQAYGGPKNYTGRDMKAAHTGLNITEAQYDYFVSDVIVPALADAGVSTSDIMNGFAPAVTDKSAGSVKCDTVQSGTKPTGCP